MVFRAVAAADSTILYKESPALNKHALRLTVTANAVLILTIARIRWTGHWSFTSLRALIHPVTESILTPQNPAPADYYQNNFCSVFEFVLARFQGIADDSIITDLQSYLEASSDAQRLFARLLTRKGPTFLTASLKYAEVSKLDLY